MFLLVLLAIFNICHGEDKSTFARRRDAFISDYLSELYPDIADSMRPPKPLDDSKCPPGQVMNIDGSCSDVDVTQNIFVYGSPAEQASGREDIPTEFKPKLPRPKIEYNVLVIKKDEKNEEPIIIPPPKQKTVVLVLKEEKDKKRKIIEVKPNESKPEVLFVDYKEGENMQLPYGFDLNTVLAASARDGGKMSNPGGYGVLNGSIINPWTTSSPFDEYANSFGESYGLNKVKKEISSQNQLSPNIIKVKPKSHEKEVSYLSNHRNSTNSSSEFIKTYHSSTPEVKTTTSKYIQKTYNITTQLPPTYLRPPLPRKPDVVYKNHQLSYSESNQNIKIYQRPTEQGNEYLKNHRTSPLVPQDINKIYPRPPNSVIRKPSSRSKQKITKSSTKIPPKREIIPQIYNHPQTTEKGTYTDLQNLELSKIKPQVYPDIPVLNQDKKSPPPSPIRLPTRLSEKKNYSIDKKSPSLSTTTHYNNNEKFNFVPSSRIITPGSESAPVGWRRIDEENYLPISQPNTIKRVNHSALYRLPNLTNSQR